MRYLHSAALAVCLVWATGQLTAQNIQASKLIGAWAACDTMAGLENQLVLKKIQKEAFREKPGNRCFLFEFSADSNQISYSKIGSPPLPSASRDSTVFYTYSSYAQMFSGNWKLKDNIVFTGTKNNFSEGLFEIISLKEEQLVVRLLEE